MQESEKIVMMVTAASSSEASTIGKAIVEKRLAACCSIIPNIQSIYWWRGKVTEDAEVLLMIKTLKSAEAEIINTIKSMHSYELPEMISLTMTGGFDRYFNWIEENVTGPV
ncbi:divalent-cation tolerance protein CutA [candidate division KSB1 bacterium]